VPLAGGVMHGYRCERVRQEFICVAWREARGEILRRIPVEPRVLYLLLPSVYSISRGMGRICLIGRLHGEMI
jgi:hypothetical protein